MPRIYRFHGLNPAVDEGLGADCWCHPAWRSSASSCTSSALPAVPASFCRARSKPQSIPKGLQTCLGCLPKALSHTPAGQLHSPLHGGAPWLLLPAGMGLPMGCSRLCSCSVELKRGFGFSPYWSWDVSSPKVLPGKASAPQPSSSPTAPQEIRSQTTNCGGSPRVGERSWWVLLSQGKQG